MFLFCISIGNFVCTGSEETVENEKYNYKVFNKVVRINVPSDNDKADNVD